MAEKELRKDPTTGDPIVIVVNTLKRMAHSEMIDENDETIKIRLSSEWLSTFNSWVFSQFMHSVESALEDERTTLKPQDIPGFVEDEDGE